MILKKLIEIVGKKVKRIILFPQSVLLYIGDVF